MGGCPLVSIKRQTNKGYRLKNRSLSWVCLLRVPPEMVFLWFPFKTDPQQTYGCGSKRCTKIAPWYMEQKTKTCGLPWLFNFEPHPYPHRVSFWIPPIEPSIPGIQLPRGGSAALQSGLAPSSDRKTEKGI